jgi:hypothetical protein
MSSDDRLEQQLEAWLVDSAQPMPPEVLEEIIADVPRAPQAGTRGRIAPAPRWLVPGAAAVTLVIAIGMVANLARPTGPGVLPSGGSPLPSVVVRTWDPAADFLAAPDQANPAPDGYGNAGVWHYQNGPGGPHDASSYVLMPAFDAGVGKWHVPDRVNLHIYRQGSGIVLHPWGQIGGSEERRAVLTWRSPITGSVAASGSFALVDGTCTHLGDGVTVSIVDGSSVLWTAVIPSGGSSRFEVSAAVEPASTLSFVVDSTRLSECDSTLLTLRIRA